MDNWKPIESAPKDGTRILCFQKGNPEALWKKYQEDKIRVDYFFPKGSFFWDMSTEAPYTHWTDLPQPPKL